MSLFVPISPSLVFFPITLIFVLASSSQPSTSSCVHCFQSLPLVVYLFTSLSLFLYLPHLPSPCPLTNPLFLFVQFSFVSLSSQVLVSINPLVFVPASFSQPLTLSLVHSFQSSSSPILVPIIILVFVLVLSSQSMSSYKILFLFFFPIQSSFVLINPLSCSFSHHHYPCICTCLLFRALDIVPGLFVQIFLPAQFLFS